MKSISDIRLSSILVIGALFGAVIGFQNCSPNGFETNESASSFLDPRTSLGARSIANIQSKVNAARSGFGTQSQKSGMSLSNYSGDLTANEIDWIQAGKVKPNTFIRGDQLSVSVSEDYGGTIFELLDKQGRNKIDFHGGSALQLSIWGYDTEFSMRNVFSMGTIEAPKRNPVVRRSPYNENACGSAAYMPESTVFGGLIPWNPIMAQDINCAWDTYGANRVDSVRVTPQSISIEKTAPKFFNISSSVNGQFKSSVGAEGLKWWQTVEVPERSSPYVKITYRMKYENPEVGIGPHNQEMPAIYNRFKNGSTSYFYDQNQPYVSANSPVTSVPTLQRGAYLILPNQNFTSAPGDRLLRATEAWQSVCRSGPGEDPRDCLTIATFSPLAQAFAQEHIYNAVLASFALNKSFDETWTIYIFPYKYDEVINGKTVREHIYTLAEQAGLRNSGGNTSPIPLPRVCTPGESKSCPISNGSGQAKCNAQGYGFEPCKAISCSAGYTLSDSQCISLLPGGHTEVRTVVPSVGGISGQTGAWWCINHFGKNLGGAWECLDGRSCSKTANTSQQFKCGKLPTPSGYSDQSQIIAYNSAAGRTGSWWCENHFAKNLGGTWVCLGNNCSRDVYLGEIVTCGKR